MTIAKRPSHRDGMARAGSADLPDGKSEIFFGRRLDRFLVICPSGIRHPEHDPEKRVGLAFDRPEADFKCQLGWHSASRYDQIAADDQ
jgi:hypothetical protein